MSHGALGIVAEQCVVLLGTLVARRVSFWEDFRRDDRPEALVERIREFTELLEDLRQALQTLRAAYQLAGGLASFPAATTFPVWGVSCRNGYEAVIAIGDKAIRVADTVQFSAPGQCQSEEDVARQVARLEDAMQSIRIGQPEIEYLRQCLLVNAISEWAGPFSPTDAGRLFDISAKTFTRWANAKRIRARRLSAKSYMIHVDDLPGGTARMWR